MFVLCECCVLSGRGLCDELITRPEESYRLWFFVVCDLETSRMSRTWPALGRSATNFIAILLAKLYVQRKPWASERSFVLMQHRALYMKTYVRCIVTGNINFPRKHCYAPFFLYSWQSRVALHAEYTVVFPLQQW
jgi:hypothetical protein